MLYHSHSCPMTHFRSLVVSMITLVSISSAFCAEKSNKCQSGRSLFNSAANSRTTPLPITPILRDRSILALLRGDPRELRNVRTLNLANQPLTQKDFKALSQLTELRTLDLTNTNLEPKSIWFLFRMNSLTELKLNDNPLLGDRGIRKLISFASNLPHLEALSIQRCGTIRDKTYLALESFVSIRQIFAEISPDLSNQFSSSIRIGTMHRTVTPQFVPSLLPDIAHLPDFTLNATSPVSHSPSVHSMNSSLLTVQNLPDPHDLYLIRPTPEDLQRISHLRYLRSLTFDEAELDSSLIRILFDLHDLSEVRLKRVRFIDGNRSLLTFSLNHYPQLRKVTFDTCSLESKHLASLTNLLLRNPEMTLFLKGNLFIQRDMDQLTRRFGSRVQF